MMLHAILTASTDDTRLSIHWVLRELEGDGSERTIEVSGYVLPLVEVGLFGEERDTLLRGLIDCLKRELKPGMSTE